MNDVILLNNNAVKVQGYELKEYGVTALLIGRTTFLCGGEIVRDAHFVCET